MKSVTLMPCRWDTFWAAGERRTCDGAYKSDQIFYSQVYNIFSKSMIKSANLLNVTFCLTGIVRHSSLLLIPLFLELNVSQLHDCGANLHDI